MGQVDLWASFSGSLIPGVLTVRPYEIHTCELLLIVYQAARPNQSLVYSEINTLQHSLIFSRVNAAFYGADSIPQKGGVRNGLVETQGQVAISNELATSQVPALAGSGLTRVMAESPSW
jgi:hypothetical protein